MVSGEAAATIACRIQSKKYPEYWGAFNATGYSRAHHSITVIVFIDIEDKLKQVSINDWWLKKNHKPTWNELYEKLDELIERVRK